jgi:hypothetical protein
MRKCLWYSVLTILCTLSSIFAYAQDKLITGRVTDASEEALPGVSISVKNKRLPLSPMPKVNTKLRQVLEIY